MNAIEVYAILKKKITASAGGITGITLGSDGTSIDISYGAGGKDNVPFPNQLTQAQRQLVAKFSVDASGKLLFDGKDITPDFLDTTGSGDKFLADDGTYKTVRAGTGGGADYDDTQIKADIATNTNDIATNKADIATNKADIATNKTNISNLTTKIDTKADANDLTTHTSDTSIHVTTADKTKWDGYSTTINNMQTNFQAGVNTIYNSVVAKGVTPVDKSPSSIASAINSIVSPFSALKTTTRGLLTSKKSTKINFSASTMYILICTLKYADNSADRWAIYFIKNGTSNTIYYNSSSYTACSISGNNINITNNHASLAVSYILLEFVV